MRFNTLQDWLSWQENLSPVEINLGLDRVVAVFNKLNFSADFFCPVITVAGTNGKGSTVAFIESILTQAGLTAGCYTSPHLFNYNERIRINQQPVSDADLCEAFEMIDQARGELALTYFEFGTLASFVLFKKYNVDVVVLEVGLGGRLDAVNVINADIAIITSIGIDHVAWLGDNVQSIAHEKAGIMRSHRPCVVSLFKPPESLLAYADKLNVPLVQLGRDYIYQGLVNTDNSYDGSDTGQNTRHKTGHNSSSWQLNGSLFRYDNLPLPGLQGGYQLQNAAAAIVALQLLESIPATDRYTSSGQVIKPENISLGLQQVKLPGRYQVLCEQPRVIVDVAHNEQSACMLTDLLSEQPVSGRTILIIAMLADKAVTEVLTALNPQVDLWLSAGLTVARGLSAKNMAQAVRGLVADDKLTACETVGEACERASGLAAENDRIIICGSFYTVAEATKFFNSTS